MTAGQVLLEPGLAIPTLFARRLEHVAVFARRGDTHEEDQLFRHRLLGER